MITWAQVIEELTKRPIKCMDIGGGWFPEDIYSFCIPQLHDLFGAMMPLKHLDELIIQPGRALAQPTLALATRVLELRHPYDRALDIVVDGSIAELPEAAAYPHSVIVFTWQNREWQVLGKGDSQILGRLCMENDILAQGIRIPDNIQRGDIVVFCDAGAYDRSMSYVFGQG
jgi:diaminopimelate decarboxylase